MKHKSEFKSQEHRQEKIAEHITLESRRHIRDRKCYIIDDDDAIDSIIEDEKIKSGYYVSD